MDQYLFNVYDVHQYYLAHNYNKTKSDKHQTQTNIIKDNKNK